MPAELKLPVGGVELAVRRGAVSDSAGAGAGAGAEDEVGGALLTAAGDIAAAVLCLHETGATVASWAPLAESLERLAPGAFEVIRFDRRGWGGSTAPEIYQRTTVGEQAQDALALLDELALERALLVGAGIGAVLALDLALREPARVRAVVAVEPPLLALAEGATEGLSGDVATLRDAAEEVGLERGREVAAELFLAGELPYLAPGSERLRSRETAGGGDGDEPLRRPGSLIAELGAVPAWPLPFEDLAESRVPAALVVGSASPPPVREAAVALEPFAAAAELVDLAEPDPLAAGDALAGLVKELVGV